MKNNKNRTTMTEEEVLRDPSLSHFHEAVRFLKDKPNKDIFPKKYESAVIAVAMEHLYELFEENPNMPFKAILTTVMKELPKQTTDMLLSKVVKSAAEVWEELVASTKKEKQTLIVS